MTILSKLSSQVGERTEEGNRFVVTLCMENPLLLNEIKGGLKEKDPLLIGDCVEVITKVAEVHPELVVSFTDLLIELLHAKTKRIRWEAIHAISLLTPFIPEQIFLLLPTLIDLIHHDKSTIVRDYSIQTLVNFATIGEEEALTVYPILKDSLPLWNGKHRNRVLSGLLNVCKQAPTCILEIRGIAEEFIEDNRTGVRKTARSIVKAIDKWIV
ncbi:hypothetical protein CJ195_06580 [Bacillus sp. UMB0899]|nr:hypothetical protein CJ195_06580 [Bacillus sp. UMB0899]